MVVSNETAEVSRNLSWLLYYRFTAESRSEWILKITQHQRGYGQENGGQWLGFMVFLSHPVQ